MFIRYLRNFIFIFSCLFSLTVEAYSLPTNYDPIALYLTWMHNPDRTMVISWITLSDRPESSLEYRPENSQEWFLVQGTHTHIPTETSYLLHRVVLTHLQPSTSYYFRTGTDALTYKFKTMPETLNEEIRFVAGGDMYHDNIELIHETNRQAAKTSPHFALVGGDIAYASEKISALLPQWTQPLLDRIVGQKFDRWLAWLIAWKNDMVTPEGHLIPLLPVLGNHDTSGRFGQTPAQAPFFYFLFPLPGAQGYNVLDFGMYLSILLLDSGHTHPIGGAQTYWLKTCLEQRVQIPHKFALYHVPAYPSVRSFNNEISKQIRKHWIPHFDQYHLTAAFENHDHAYKRTYPILNGQINPTGVLYLGDGAWGVEKPRKARELEKKWYLLKTSPERHFLFVSLKQNRRYVAAISSKGHLIDEVTWQ